MEAEFQTRMAGTRPGSGDLTGLRILCADDNPQVGDVLVALLTRRGHFARHAENGRAAWEILSRELGSFDVVITDDQMPGMGGADLVGLLRQEKFPGRIVVYSSSLSDRGRAHYELLRVDRIVEKSAQPGDLIAAVEGR